MDANNSERAMKKPTRVRRGKHKYNNPEQTKDSWHWEKKTRKADI